MNEEVFNMEIRKFLKKVGINSQREIEQAVRDALAGSKIGGTEVLPARMTLTIDKIGLTVSIDGSIALG